MPSTEPSQEIKRRITQDIAVREATKAAQAALGVTADGVFGVKSLVAVLDLVARCKRYEITEGPQIGNA